MASTNNGRGPEYDDFDAPQHTSAYPTAEPAERSVDLPDGVHLDEPGQRTESLDPEVREQAGVQVRHDGVGPTQSDDEFTRTQQLPAASHDDYIASHRTAAYDETTHESSTAYEADLDAAAVPLAGSTALDPNAPSDDETAKAGFRITRLGGWLLGILRVLFGLQFLWAFLDKTFGLGYSTTGNEAWVDGGSPTKGFLDSVTADDSDNPFKPMFTFFGDQGWTDWVFMIGLAGIGIALILGVAIWVTAICGAVLFVLMYLAAWPIAENPFIDGHLLGAVTLLALAACNAGAYLGLGRAWRTRRAHR